MAKTNRHALPILLLLCTLSASATERETLHQGIDAFRGERYEEALQHFQDAEAQGLRSVTLDYNLGATHYRLGNHSQSTHHFQRIRNDAQWGALAEYNLGLIAERQEMFDQARAHYKAAARKATSDRILQLAHARLQALEPSPVPAVADPGWVFYLSAAAAYDDNPALVKGDDFAPGKDSDYLLETLGSLSGYLRGDRRDGIRLNAGFYTRHHNDLSEFDITGLSASVFLDSEGETWRIERGIRVAGYWLDNSRYTTEGALALRGIRPVGAFDIDLRNDLSYIDAAGDFDFVEGVRNRLSAELVGTADFGRWRVGYVNEFSDRDDFASGDEFLSYSPWRHAVHGEIRRRLNERLDLQARLEYRHSRYRDDNLQIEPDTSVTEKQRKDDRLLASMTLRYMLDRTFSTFLEYRYTDNDSNFDRFSYRGNQVQLGIDAVF